MEIMLSYQLMQMADTGLPTGGFAFSQGLESAAVQGMVSEATLEAYLLGVIEQWGSFELPFLNDFYHGQEGVLEDYDCTFLSVGLYKASLAQGRALARLWNWSNPDPPHYLAVFAAGLAAEGWALEDVQKLFLHNGLRDQFSSAVRLGLTGPLAASRLQKKLHPQLERVRIEHASKTSEQAFRASPCLDIVQASHPQLYTKLFQN